MTVLWIGALAVKISPLGIGLILVLAFGGGVGFKPASERKSK